MDTKWGRTTRRISVAVLVALQAMLVAAPCAVGQREQGALPVPALRRAWGPEQATGAPDTHEAGDWTTAWASRQPNAGTEWLRLEFQTAVDISEVRVRETFNPGAVTRVTAFLEDGTEDVLWEGEDPTTLAPDDFVVTVERNLVSKSVKVYLDTTRRPGWNEIDAVELVGKDGARQWAASASASSTFAERAAPVFAVSAPTDVFARFLQAPITVHVEGNVVLAGRLVAADGQFLLLEAPERNTALIINKQRIIYVEVGAMGERPGTEPPRIPLTR